MKDHIKCDACYHMGKDVNADVIVDQVIMEGKKVLSKQKIGYCFECREAMKESVKSQCPYCHKVWDVI